MTLHPERAHPAAAIFLQSVSMEAKTDEVRATEAVREAIRAFPDATRVGIKHAAIVAGINGYTARNTYDRVQRGH